MTSVPTFARAFVEAARPWVLRPVARPVTALAAQLDTARPPAAGRMTGVDVARAVAIVGMLAVHVGPTGQGTVAGRLYALPHGRASLLFMLLAGIGVSLLASSWRTSPAQTRGKLLWRAALLLPVGLVLQTLDHGAFVILQEYAVLFVLATVALTASDRVLMAGAAGLVTVGPVVHLVGQMRAPALFERDGLAVTDPVGEIAHGLVLSGPFPLVTWAVPFLVGMWLGRRDLRSATVRAWLIVGGAALAAGALAVSAVLVAVVGDPTPPPDASQLIARNAHSQMPLWLLSGVGVATMLLGLCLVASERAGSVLWPLAATGQLALTVYVAHLVALHVAPTTLTSDEVAGATAIVVVVSGVAVAAATAWRAVMPRGPLEALLQLPWWAARRWRAAR